MRAFVVAVVLVATALALNDSAAPAHGTSSCQRVHRASIESLVMGVLIRDTFREPVKGGLIVTELSEARGPAARAS
eukprot:scaffold1147_cov68-Phaeocystis_antarctica.AAC.3